MEVKRNQENEQQKTIRRRMIKAIQERIVRDITNLLDQEEDCCKPAVSTGNIYIATIILNMRVMVIKIKLFLNQRIP